MLVVLSFVLVLIATVLLVLGLLNDGGLPMIYISIACSAAAGIVLLVAVRLSRPTPSVAGGGPEPLSEPAREPVPAAAATATLPRLAEPPVAEPVAEEPVVEEAPPPVEEPVAEEPEEEPEVEETVTIVPAEEPVAEEEPADAEWRPEPAAAEAVGGEEAWDGFPIADYDDLKVTEILPLLPELYSDELDVVEDRERHGKGRATLLSRIAELRANAPDGDVPVGAGAAASASSDDTEASPAPAKTAAAKKTAAKKTAAKTTTTAKKTAAKKTAAKKTTDSGS